MAAYLHLIPPPGLHFHRHLHLGLKILINFITQLNDPFSCLPVRPSVCLSVCLSVRLSVCLSVCLFVRP